MKQKQNKKRFLSILGVVSLVILLIVLACDSRLKTVHYTVESNKVNVPIRIALITDLHSCNYGKNQKNLIEAVQKQNPDIVLLGGDIFDDKLSYDNAELAVRQLAELYPCYYVTGNHEYWSRDIGTILEIVKDCGVTALSGECDTININGQVINICGVDDPDVEKYLAEGMSIEEQLKNVSEAAQEATRGVLKGEAQEVVQEVLQEEAITREAAKETVQEAVQEEIWKIAETTSTEIFTVLLSHRPELFEIYQKYEFDLVLSGHAHGGQWRIPGLLNGLFAPNQGLFPKYAGGRYDYDGGTMIVSRGLARESTRIPRIFNRPELVIVDVK